MTISFRLNDVDSELVHAYAEYNNETVSAYIRRLVMSDIENAYYKVLDKYLDSSGNNLDY